MKSGSMGRRRVCVYVISDQSDGDGVQSAKQENENECLTMCVSGVITAGEPTTTRERLHALVPMTAAEKSAACSVLLVLAAAGNITKIPFSCLPPVRN